MLVQSIELVLHFLLAQLHLVLVGLAQFGELAIVFDHDLLLFQCQLANGLTERRRRIEFGEEGAETYLVQFVNTPFEIVGSRFRLSEVSVLIFLDLPQTMRSHL